MKNNANRRPWCVLAHAAGLLAPVAALAQAPAGADPSPALQALQQRIDRQQQELQQLREALARQEERMRALQQAVAPPPAAGPPQGAAVASQQPDAGAGAGERPVQVGTAPAAESVAPVAQLFEQPGVLTPPGRTVFEPSLQYGYSSSNRAALVGFTVIPALLIGLVDVREVKRNTWTGAITLRRGLTNRMEVEAKLPYVYRSDTAISREIFTGTASEAAFHTSGRSIGDVEVTGRYQLTDGTGRWPYLIGSLRFKSRTGKDPFDVVTDCVTRCVGNTTGTGQPLELPTGSGFYTLQPGITWLLPSDPAVFFGSFTYAWNIKRSGISRRVLGGEREFIGEVDPGDTLGMNFGMGLALNDRSTFSIGVDLASIGRTKQNGLTVPGSVRTQLASVLLGYSYRYSARTTVNLAVGAGLTRDTPDLTLTLRVPFNL